MTATLDLARLHAVRERQAALHQRPYTASDRAATEYLAAVAGAAVADLRSKAAINFRVASMPTGYGKTTAAVAFIVAMLEADPTFSAVYVCRERRLAEEVADMIDALAQDVLGHPVATAYTEAHACRRDRVADHDYFMDTFRFVPCRPVVQRPALSTARVAVVTHAAWKSEAERGQPGDVLYFRGRRRLAFVDEQPDLVDIVELQPSTVQALHDAVAAHEEGSPMAQRLAEIVAAMSEVMQDDGAQWYAAPAITREEDFFLFADLRNAKSLERYVVGRRPTERVEHRATLARAVHFIVAAAQSAAFFSRRHRSFWSFDWAVAPGPGHVLLDATADLGPIVAFMPGVERMNAPAVNYGNLEVVHVPQPRAFRRVNDVLRKQKTGKAYGAWMREVITSVAPRGAKVLVVAHMDVFGLEFFPEAADAEKPMDIDGRMVVTLHWGAGIGSNRFKDCDHVILFGEWHLPREATIATVHGHLGEPVDADGLRQAVGRPAGGGRYEPKGNYRTASEGHLLRWTVQLCARGAVRNIDGDGRCGKMTLVTTMDRGRLARHFSTLFPGARPPRTIAPKHGAKPAKPKGRDALCHLLSTSTADRITAAEAAAYASLRPQDMSREVRAVQDVARLHGWRLVTNREAGLKGKGRVLVRGGCLLPAAA